MSGFLERWTQHDPADRPIELAGEIHDGEDRSLLVNSPNGSLPSRAEKGRSITIEALHKTAELLAIAYRRHAAIQRVGPDRSGNSVNDALANSSGSSVHGVVP